MVRLRESLIALWALGAVMLLWSNGGCGSNSPGNDFGSPSGDDASTSGGSTSSGASSGSGSSSSGGAIFTNPADRCRGSAAWRWPGMLRPDGLHDEHHRHRLRPGGRQPALQRRRLRPERPHGALTPIKQGTNSCNSCDVSIGDYVAATTSKADGTFTLTGVPATTHVPLVVQIGKWRREVFLSQVKACTNNVLQGSSLTRLPTNQIRGRHPADGARDRRRRQPRLLPQGDRPRRERVLRAARGRTARHLPGAPAATSILGVSVGGAPGLTERHSRRLHDGQPELRLELEAELREIRHRAPLLRGQRVRSRRRALERQASNKTTTAKQALHDWLDEGGKVFATHYHYTWFKNSPHADFKDVATWLGSSGAQGGNAATTSTPRSRREWCFHQWLAPSRR